MTGTDGTRCSPRAAGAFRVPYQTMRYLRALPRRRPSRVSKPKAGTASPFPEAARGRCCVPASEVWG